MSKKPIPVKVAFLGDQKVGKTTFIKNYAGEKSEVKIAKEKGPHFIFNTEIKIDEETSTFKISIFKFSEKSDKYTSVIADCHCVFILFDMSKRESFERLLDYWIIYVRDVCKYKSQIIILGNYFNKNDFLTTDKDELKDLIEVCEIRGEFIEIGNLDNSQKKEQLNKIIENCCRVTKTVYNQNECLKLNLAATLLIKIIHKLKNIYFNDNQYIVLFFRS